MTDGKIRKIASRIAQKWYKEEYGGYHWGTADEIVEEFLIWLLTDRKAVEIILDNPSLNSV